MKKPVITGNMSLEVGETLNLTCRTESFPPSQITWTKLGSKTRLQSEPMTDVHNNIKSATLLIHGVMTEHSGQYDCTIKHLNTTVTISAGVTVTCEQTVLIVKRKLLFTFSST